MTIIYFIKTEYTGNVYKTSDFYNSNGSFLKPTNRSMAVDMRFNDGETTLQTQIRTLPDGSNIRDYTHVTIPSINKIYRITKIDDLNHDSSSIYLDDDPLIAHLNELKSADILVTRTNDSSKFKGIIDSPKIELRPTVTVQSLPWNYKSGKVMNTGRWALLTLQVPTSTTMLKLIYSPLQPDEDFTTLSAVQTRYPELTTTTPQTVPYFQMVVRVGGITYYQCVYSNTENRLRWTTITGNNAEQWITLNNNAGKKLNKTGINTVNLILPYERNIRYVYGSSTYRNLLTFDRFVGLNNPDILYSVRIIDDILLPFSDFTTDYNSSNPPIVKNVWSVNSSTLGCYKTEQGSSVNDNETGLHILNVDELGETLDVSLTGYGDIIDNYEPFKSYKLSIYGEEYDIPFKYARDLKVTLAYSNTDITYVIRGNNIHDVLASGSISNEIAYQVDKLDLFYAQNPNYKEQYNLGQWQKMMGMVVGGVTTAVSNPVGAAVNMGVNLANMGFDIANEKLSRESKQKTADSIYGKTSNVYLQSNLHFGVYWKIITSDFANEMKLMLYKNGFPSQYYGKISTNSQTNPIYGNCKIVAGTLVSVIRNEYVTNYINEKLQNGIIIKE